jgi:hypothetical protein
MPENDDSRSLGPSDSRPVAPVVVPSEERREELAKMDSGCYRKYARFVLAALGSIPWVGGLLGATAGLNAEFDQGKLNDLQRKWLEEHTRRLEELGSALSEITTRLDQIGEEVKSRVESEEYLGIVRKGFRVWDQSDTSEKRRLVQKLLANAGATTVTHDDVVSLFIEWIERYHEAHFAVIREIFANPGSTRAEIWDSIHGTQPRDDSAEADLFKLLISDLSLGRVIRQERASTSDGQFLRKRTNRGQASPVMKSPFDDKERYELTGLGKQFVHYTMSEVVKRVAP